MTNELVQKVLQLAVKAGRAILDIYDTSDFGVEMKTDKSPLTRADKAAHDVIAEGLQEFSYPVLSEEGKSIAYEERKNWKRFWMVDPLDGTKEFIKKNGEFTVNIALIEDGRPVMGVVYAPVLHQAYVGCSEGAFRYTVDAENDALLGSERITVEKPGDKLIVVASRSHLNDDTLAYIDQERKAFAETDFVSKGSSLKLVLVAEGNAHLYPRYAPTMEWDTAAGHAVVLAAGGTVQQVNGEALVYNKENLLNPYFVVRS